MFARKLLAFALVAAVLASPAHAADALAQGSHNWTGAYIGGDLGYGWGNSSGVQSNYAGLFPLPYSTALSGIQGGGFLGYNYQIDHVVLGLEGDWQAAKLVGSSRPTGYKMSTSVDGYGSLRGRLGYAFDKLVVFGTGGAAWGTWESKYAVAGAAPYYKSSTSNHLGWTAGAGAEYALTENWGGRLEYRYTDLGALPSYSDVGSNSADSGNKVHVNSILVGVSYKFGAL